MTLVKHELRQGKLSLAIWTISIGIFIALCVFMYPEMQGEMEGVSELFASMGMFSTAFGMDQLNFGTLIGFYAVECGNILGIGGALFASLIGISALAKEERERTAEFLLTHPVSRSRIYMEKLVAVILQILILNIVVYLISIASVIIIGEEVPWTEMNLLHLSNGLMQLELACICYGGSAFIKKGGLGAGLGLAIVMYFLNILANISDSAEFLKYITPFGYTEGADILANLTLDKTMVCMGVVYAIIGIIIGYWKYNKKDMG